MTNSYMPYVLQRWLAARVAFATFATCVTCTQPALADDKVRTPVPDARPVLLGALRAQDGQAYGVLTGDMADAITKHFSATSPIYIDVTTERHYAQAGCSRLKVTFWQEGVLLAGAPKPRRQTMDVGINYCLDGRPPKSPQ